MTVPSRPQAPDQNYEVTPLELFFDLVFVFAVSP
jgi:low temperature requirement protein LtrA